MGRKRKARKRTSPTKKKAKTNPSSTKELEPQNNSEDDVIVISSGEEDELNNEDHCLESASKFEADGKTIQMGCTIEKHEDNYETILSCLGIENEDQLNIPTVKTEISHSNDDLKSTLIESTASTPSSVNTIIKEEIDESSKSSTVNFSTTNIITPEQDITDITSKNVNSNLLTNGTVEPSSSSLLIEPMSSNISDLNAAIKKEIIELNHPTTLSCPTMNVMTHHEEQNITSCQNVNSEDEIVKKSQDLTNTTSIAASNNVGIDHDSITNHLPLSPAYSSLSNSSEVSSLPLVVSQITTASIEDPCSAKTIINIKHEHEVLSLSNSLPSEIVLNKDKSAEKISSNVNSLNQNTDNIHKSNVLDPVSVENCNSPDITQSSSVPDDEMNSNVNNNNHVVQNSNDVDEDVQFIFSDVKNVDNLQSEKDLFSDTTKAARTLNVIKEFNPIWLKLRSNVPTENCFTELELFLRKIYPIQRGIGSEIFCKNIAKKLFGNFPSCLSDIVDNVTSNHRSTPDYCSNDNTTAVWQVQNENSTSVSDNECWKIPKIEPVEVPLNILPKKEPEDIHHNTNSNFYGLKTPIINEEVPVTLNTHAHPVNASSFVINKSQIINTIENSTEKACEPLCKNNIENELLKEKVPNIPCNNVSLTNLAINDISIKELQDIMRIVKTSNITDENRVPNISPEPITNDFPVSDDDDNTMDPGIESDDSDQTVRHDPLKNIPDKSSTPPSNEKSVKENIPASNEKSVAEKVPETRKKTKYEMILERNKRREQERLAEYVSNFEKAISDDHIFHPNKRKNSQLKRKVPHDNDSIKKNKTKKASNDTSSNKDSQTSILECQSENVCVGETGSRKDMRFASRNSFLFQDMTKDAINPSRPKSLTRYKQSSQINKSQPSMEEVHSQISVDEIAVEPVSKKVSYEEYLKRKSSNNNKTSVPSFRSDQPVEQNIIENTQMITPLQDPRLARRAPLISSPNVQKRNVALSYITSYESLDMQNTVPRSTLPVNDFPLIYPQTPTVNINTHPSTINNLISASQNIGLMMPTLQNNFDQTPGLQDRNSLLQSTFGHSHANQSAIFFQSPSSSSSPRLSPFDQSWIPPPQSPLVHSSITVSPSKESPRHVRRNSSSHEVCLCPSELSEFIGKEIIEQDDALLFILTWVPNWLKEWLREVSDPQKKCLPPPICGKPNFPLNPVNLKFKSAKDYFNVYFPLLLHDIFYRIFEQWKTSLKNEKLELDLVNSHMGMLETTHILTYKKSFPGEGNFGIATFTLNDNQLLDSFVYVKNQNIKVNSNKLEVLHLTLRTAYQLTNIDKTKKIKLHSFFPLSKSMFLIKALGSLSQSPLCEILLNPHPPECSKMELEIMGSVMQSLQKIEHATGQIIDLLRLKYPTENRLLLIDSPLGTDFIATFMGLVETLKKSSIANEIAKQRILICVRSHKRLEDIGLRLLAAAHNAENPALNITSIVLSKSKNVPNAKLRKLCFEEQVNQYITDNKLNSHNKKVLMHDVRIEVQQKLLQNCDVVLTNIFQSSDSDINLMLDINDKFHFSFAIIDEVYLCTEIECLSALLFGINKLALVGDPTTSPRVVATILSDKKFYRSLANRISENLSDEN